MFILKLPWGQWSKTYCAMSPAESEGLNKKSLVLPETKISLKLIRSSGIVKRGILEAVVLAPVDVQAALFLGLKVFWGQEQIWPREAQKILQLILIYIKGILDEASRQRGPRLSRSCRLRRPPSFFSCSQITTHSFSREEKINSLRGASSSKKTALFFLIKTKFQRSFLADCFNSSSTRRRSFCSWECRLASLLLIDLLLLE